MVKAGLLKSHLHNLSELQDVGIVCPPAIFATIYWPEQTRADIMVADTSIPAPSWLIHFSMLRPRHPAVLVIVTVGEEIIS